jgi:two-component system chemotaxis response regulator CheB
MKFKIVAVGTSLGGFDALSVLLGGLPADFRIPVVVVQHRSVDDSEGLAPLVAKRTSLRVHEVEDKQRIEDGCVYLSPANYHLMIDRNQFALSTDKAVLSARPSIDVLFESAADAFRSGTIGVLLTGASRDGTRGLAQIKAMGGFTIVQDPNTAEAPLMPASAIRQVRVDKVLPLSDIAPYIEYLCRSEEAAYKGKQ